jgi:very-short-patch-repair endonuclease
MEKISKMANYSNHSPEVIRAKTLRKNMSSAEKKFWHAINYGKLNWKFRRQQPIGPYYVDFVCFDKKLIIELDGEQHATKEVMNYDSRRTDYLESCGYKLIRIPNGYIGT